MTVALAAIYDALLAPFVFIVVGAWLRDPRDRIHRFERSAWCSTGDRR